MQADAGRLETRVGYRLILMTLVLPLLAAASVKAATDPLPSWNDSQSRSEIVAFVEAVSTRGGPSYVPPADRIATFDNDGTLWAEKPLYIHFYAVFDHMKKQMAADPALKQRQPYKSVATREKDYFVSLYEAASYDTLLGQLIGVPFGGMSVGEFERWGRQWMKDWKHPRFKVGYRQLTYQPMVELIRYLEDNHFKVYIFTADEAAFLRLVTEEIYGLEPQRVHGSAARLEYVVEGGTPVLIRTYQAEYFDNWAGKPRLIERIIGKRPILAGGNSNGDYHMLQYVAEQDRRSLAILVHHTDAEREYAYDSHTDKVMPLARKDGWTIVDMKQDWRTVFPTGDQ